MAYHSKPKKKKPMKKKAAPKRKPMKKKKPSKKKVKKATAVRLTKAQEAKLSKYSGHHSAKHMSMMRREMKKGKSFAAAHRMAKKAVGK
jgi:hypothetical protein